MPLAEVPARMTSAWQLVDLAGGDGHQPWHRHLEKWPLVRTALRSLEFSASLPGRRRRARRAPNCAASFGRWQDIADPRGRWRIRRAPSCRLQHPSPGRSPAARVPVIRGKEENLPECRGDRQSGATSDVDQLAGAAPRSRQGRVQGSRFGLCARREMAARFKGGIGIDAGFVRRGRSSNHHHFGLVAGARTKMTAPGANGGPRCWGKSGTSTRRTSTSATGWAKNSTRCGWPSFQLAFSISAGRSRPTASPMAIEIPFGADYELNAGEGPLANLIEDIDPGRTIDLTAIRDPGRSCGLGAT